MKANLSSERSLDPISHDGIHDALTFLPAPPFFYEYLYREIAITQRSQEPLTLMKLVITPKHEKESVNNCEVSIINFAKALNHSIRQSDLAARMDRYEFWLAINSHQIVASKISFRILDIWRDEAFTFSYASTHLIEGDGAISLMGRLSDEDLHLM